jgi:hypothetical protein
MKDNPTATSSIGNSMKGGNSEVFVPAAEQGEIGSGSKLTGVSWVWVYDKLVTVIKVRHYSPKTLRTYKGWLHKFHTFAKSKSPRLLSMEEVKGF